MHSKKLTIGASALVAAFAFLVVGCSAGVEEPSAGKVISSSGGVQKHYYESRNRFYFESPHDIHQMSDLVVVGKIVKEWRSPARRLRETSRQDRLLEIDVERTLKGSPADPLTVTADGWLLVDGQEEREVWASDGVRPKVGDRGVFALINGLAGRADELFFTNQQAVLFLAGGQVVTTPRRDPFVRQLEGLSEQQLIQTLEEASSP